jgi:hypothetical protein
VFSSSANRGTKGLNLSLSLSLLCLSLRSSITTTEKQSAEHPFSRCSAVQQSKGSNRHGGYPFGIADGNSGAANRQGITSPRAAVGRGATPSGLPRALHPALVTCSCSGASYRGGDGSRCCSDRDALVVDAPSPSTGIRPGLACADTAACPSMRPAAPYPCRSVLRFAGAAAVGK